MILNRLKGVFNTIAIKAPAFGDRRKEVLEDIAVLTGGQVISEEQGFTFENADIAMLGTASRVIVDKDNTTIIEGGGSATNLKARVAQISAQGANASSDYDKENFDKRRAALDGKVAVIKVGGATETEIEEKKFRVDDAVAAVKAALDEGIVSGGGVTLVNLATAISDNDAGKTLLKNALVQPFVQLMENAGLNAQALLAQVQSAKPGQGVDVNDPDAQLVDLKKVGVIDPARVTKEAIMNASSIAGTAMTMGALVVDIPEKNPAPTGGGMDPSMMGM